MAISPMTRAEPDTIASSADYNVVLDNVEDVDSRLQTVENASAVYFHGWVLADTYVVNSGGGGSGVNFEFDTTGLVWEQRGGFTVSGSQIIPPSAGKYLITAQAAWLPGTPPSTGTMTTGMYALLDGTSGANDACASKETKFPGNEDAIIEQISGVADCTSSSFLTYRLYTNTSDARSVRGVQNATPYGGTYIYITKDA